jgi:hypothetical protein
VAYKIGRITKYRREDGMLKMMGTMWTNNNMLSAVAILQ